MTTNRIDAAKAASRGTAPRRSPDRESVDAYQRFAKHERSLWFTTIAVVVMNAITIAILTIGAAFAGAFDGPYRGFLLAGGSFLLLALFIAYVGMQREGLEENRARIFSQLERHSEELRRTNEALQEALSTQETFLSCVSHELKTPLTCIMGYADFMASGQIPAERTAETSRGILDEGRALNQLIDRILEVTKLRSGKLKLQREEMNVVEVVQAVVKRLRPQAAEQGIRLLGDFKDGPLTTLLDRGRAEEAVSSLVRRAMDRSSEGGEVFVNTRPLGKEWAEVSVEDQGPRIPREEQSALFRPFGEMDANPAGRAGDLGLALPLVQQVVMAHGGDVYAQEVGVRGLRFRALFPRKERLQAGGRVDRDEIPIHAKAEAV